jgi:tripartite-type tricarboxylate transporter receptor subunit TctC
MLHRSIGILACLLISASVAAADEFPSKTITIVNPYAAGGGIDFVARAIAQKLSEQWNVPVIIENKPGAGGTIAADSVVRRPADGYTLFITDVSYSTVPSLYSQLRYDPIKDLQPVILLCTVPQILVTRADLGVESIPSLVEYAKREPGKLTYASAGNGSLPHIAAEMFKNKTGTDIQQVFYRGSVPAFTDLVAGRVDMYIGALATPLPFIQEGTVKALAVMQKNRSSLVPNVPSIGELGHPELEFDAYYGLLAPAGVPQEIVEKIAAAAKEALATPEVKKTMEQLGNEIAGGGPQEFRTFLDRSFATWRKGMEVAGIKPQ